MFEKRAQLPFCLKWRLDVADFVSAQEVHYEKDHVVPHRHGLLLRFFNSGKITL
jgi:hypothetical protein